MALGPILRTTLRVADVLDRLGVPYLVGGSLASSLHGIPRATQDVDLVADLAEEAVSGFVAALEGDFYVDEGMVREAVRRRASFNVIEFETMFKLDVFVVGRDVVTRTEMVRRQTVPVGEEAGQTLVVASAEDIILQKLAWYRLGGGVSERQWLDVLGVLKVQGPRLDGHYLHETAERMAVTDLLERALREAGQ